jgi:hypothetical protein
MKYNIKTKVTRTYDVHFNAPNKLTADKVMDQLDDHLSFQKIMKTPETFPARIAETRLSAKLGVKDVIVKEDNSSHSVEEPESMDPDDIAIRREVEHWNGNYNSFEIYDKLRDEYSESHQRKLINYAKKYFHNCQELQYQFQDMADTLGIDLEEDEDE